MFVVFFMFVISLTKDILYINTPLMSTINFIFFAFFLTERIFLGFKPLSSIYFFEYYIWTDDNLIHFSINLKFSRSGRYVSVAYRSFKKIG